jgi:uncharacterized protein YbjT (DUF2867 family)
MDRIAHVVVTGGSGKAGRAVVRDLVEHGYDVVNVDPAPDRDGIAPRLTADLTDFGIAVEALRGADAVVHLAAIPAPRADEHRTLLSIDKARRVMGYAPGYSWRDVPIGRARAQDAMEVT